MTLNLLKKISFTTLSIWLVLLTIFSYGWVIPVHPQGVSEKGIEVYENQIVTVEDRSLILTGNITVNDNGTLILRRSDIQLSIRGEETYNVTISGDGRLILESSELSSLSPDSQIVLAGNANLTVSAGSTLKGFAAINSTGNTMLNARKGRLEVELIQGEFGAIRLEDAENPEGEIHAEANMLNLELFIGELVNVSCINAILIESNFQSLIVNASNTVEVLSLNAGESIIESKEIFRLDNSTFEELSLGGKGEAYNVIVTAGPNPTSGGQIYALANSTVRRYWYLSINVTDIARMKIPAWIYLYHMNGTEAFAMEADMLGLVYNIVLAEIINASATKFVGNYRIQAVYGNYSTALQPLTMEMNKEISLQFKEVIPLPTATYLQLSGTRFRVGDKLTVSGWIEQQIGGALIEITYENPEQEPIVKAVTTDVGGSFTTEFIPYMVGEWTVYAEWIGGSEFVKDKMVTSRPRLFIVEERPTLQEILIRVFPILIIVVVVIIALAYFALQRRPKRRRLTKQVS